MILFTPVFFHRLPALFFAHLLSSLAYLSDSEVLRCSCRPFQAEIPREFLDGIKLSKAASRGVEGFVGSIQSHLCHAALDVDAWNDTCVEQMQMYCISYNIMYVHVLSLNVVFIHRQGWDVIGAVKGVGTILSVACQKMASCLQLSKSARLHSKDKHHLGGRRAQHDSYDVWICVINKRQEHVWAGEGEVKERINLIWWHWTRFTTVVPIINIVTMIIVGMSMAWRWLWCGGHPGYEHMAQVGTQRNETRIKRWYMFMVHKAGIPSQNQGRRPQLSWLEDIVPLTFADFYENDGIVVWVSPDGAAFHLPPFVSQTHLRSYFCSPGVGEPRNSQKVALECFRQATIDSLQGWLANVALSGRLHSKCFRTHLASTAAKPHLLTIVLQRLVDLDSCTPALVSDPHSGMLNIEIKRSL